MPDSLDAAVKQLVEDFWLDYKGTFVADSPSTWTESIAEHIAAFAREQRDRAVMGAYEDAIAIVTACVEHNAILKDWDRVRSATAEIKGRVPADAQRAFEGVIASRLAIIRKVVNTIGCSCACPAQVDSPNPCLRHKFERAMNETLTCAESAFHAAVEAKVAERIGAVIEKWASTAQTLRKSAVGMLPAKRLATYHEAALLEGHGKALKSALTAPAEGPKGGGDGNEASAWADFLKATAQIEVVINDLKHKRDLAVAEARREEANWWSVRRSTWCKCEECESCRQRLVKLTAERDRIAGKGGKT